MATAKPARTRSRDSSLPDRLEDLMNVGPRIAQDLRCIGIRSPIDLRGKDPYRLFEKLCRETGHQHDPCVLDTFISVVRIADGGPSLPWWHYTAERKRSWSKRMAGRS